MVIKGLRGSWSSYTSCVTGQGCQLKWHSGTWCVSQPATCSFMENLKASQPNEILRIDFIVREPSCNGMEDILVMTDVFSEYTWAVPTRDLWAATVAQILVVDWLVLKIWCSNPDKLKPGTELQKVLHSAVWCFIWYQEVSHHTIPSCIPITPPRISLPVSLFGQELRLLAGFLLGSCWWLCPWVGPGAPDLLAGCDSNHSPASSTVWFNLLYAIFISGSCGNRYFSPCSWRSCCPADC